MLPISYLSKMGIYDIELQGFTIKTSVCDNAAVIDSCISKLRSSVAGNVVGVDVKRVVGRDLRARPRDDAALLILCAGTQCLIIQLYHTALPDTVKNFVTDETICFVGAKTAQKFSNPTWRMERDSGCSLSYRRVVELGKLAARVLKKPSLIECSVLKELAEEVGIDYKEHPIPIEGVGRPNWGAEVLSHEEVKYAVQDAYSYHIIGKKILGML